MFLSIQIASEFSWNVRLYFGDSALRPIYKMIALQTGMAGLTSVDPGFFLVKNFLDLSEGGFLQLNVLAESRLKAILASTDCI